MFGKLYDCSDYCDEIAWAIVTWQRYKIMILFVLMEKLGEEIKKICWVLGQSRPVAGRCSSPTAWWYPVCFCRKRHMTNIVLRNGLLPEDINKLKDFILLNREKVKAYKLKFESIERLGLAKVIRDNTLKEGQELSSQLLHAEAKLGDMLKNLPQKKPTKRLSRGVPRRLEPMVIWRLAREGIKGILVIDRKRQSRRPSWIWWKSCIFRAIKAGAAPRSEVVNVTQILPSV